MITAWILYSILVGALVAGSALVLDRLLRAHGLPSRWIWAGAMLLSSGWPLGHWIWRNIPRDIPQVALPDLPPMALVLEPLVVEVPPQSILHLLDGPILVAWAVATGLLLSFFTFLVFRTHRLRGQWRAGEAGGQAVLYSDEWGPAVVGFLRPQVVLPEWCRDLEERALRFVLEHEMEHARAGDLRLILTAGILPVIFPWHIPLWWQLVRLRLAVEGDCDLRVLRRNPGRTRPYVELLLNVGKKAPPEPPHGHHAFRTLRDTQAEDPDHDHAVAKKPLDPRDSPDRDGWVPGGRGLLGTEPLGDARGR
ncbi:M56 family metallopeptidase [Gemmatimonadota bacterium]